MSQGKGRASALAVLVLLGGGLAGCVACEQCRYNDYFAVASPGLFEAIVAKDGSANVDTNGEGRAPDWVTRVWYHPGVLRLEITTVYPGPRQPPVDVLKLRVDWPEYHGEQRARATTAEILGWAGYPDGLLPSIWSAWCEEQSRACSFRADLPRQPLGALLDHAAAGAEVDWAAASSFEHVGWGDWHFDFRYDEVTADVDVGDLVVGLSASTSGVTHVSVAWQDGRDVKVPHDQALAAVGQAIASYGLPSNGLRELADGEGLPPPSLQDR